MTTFIFISIYAAFILGLHVANELRIYRRGGDVYEWTKKLERMLHGK
jgi:hypothetical protein